MKTTSKVLLCIAVLAGFAGCVIFDDPTPDFLTFHMDGTPGSVATVIYSKQFVAGLNENGLTRLEIFGSDTVVHTLPIDTVLNIQLERQMFIQVEAGSVLDTLAVGVRIDIDDRNIFANSGAIFPTIPWRFLYMFNVPFTADLEVIF